VQWTTAAALLHKRQFKTNDSRNEPIQFGPEIPTGRTIPSTRPRVRRERKEPAAPAKASVRGSSVAGSNIIRRPLPIDAREQDPQVINLLP